MVTPTACGLFLQSLLGSEAGMLSMLRRIFRRDNRIQTETRPREKRQKESGLLSCWETRRRKWSWGRHSESWARVRELPGRGGFKRVLLGVGLMIWILDITQWQNQSQEFQIISFSESQELTSLQLLCWEMLISSRVANYVMESSVRIVKSCCQDRVLKSSILNSFL